MGFYKRVTDWSEGELALLKELNISPDDPGAMALVKRHEEIIGLQDKGDPAFQPGSQFFKSKFGKETERRVSILRKSSQAEAPPYPLPPSGGGHAPLSFAATEAGVRLGWQHEQEEERERGRQQILLEGTLHELATELLPPADVDVAIKQTQRGEIVKSKLAFQAALEALAQRQDIEFRMAELKEREEAEARTLRQARARIFVDMLGKDVGRSVLFALSTSGT